MEEAWTKQQYLKLMIKTFVAIDYFKALQTANIFPRYDDQPPQFHTRLSFINALNSHRPAIGRVQPKLVCSWHPRLKRRELMEIMFCFTPDGNSIQNCPGWGSCKNDFLFLKYRQSPPPPPPPPPPMLTPPIKVPINVPVQTAEADNVPVVPKPIDVVYTVWNHPNVPGLLFNRLMCFLLIPLVLFSLLLKEVVDEAGRGKVR